MYRNIKPLLINFIFNNNGGQALQALPFKHLKNNNNLTHTHADTRTHITYLYNKKYNHKYKNIFGKAIGKAEIQKP